MPKSDKYHQHRTTSRRLNLVSLFAIFAIIGIFILYYLAIIPLDAAVYFIAASSITFIAYALDKRAAKNQSWRIKESRLHLLALLGGWPGALLAQQALRHKSAKTSFKIILWLTILINLGLCYLLLSSFTDQIQRML